MTTPHHHSPAQLAAALPAQPPARRPTSRHIQPGKPPRLPWLGWVCALLLLLASPAHAKRVALLMGNASYQVGRLTNPPNDVAAMEGALTRLGFQIHKVLNANQNQMRRAVRDFGTAAQGAEVAFVYYSGHATQANGENYLLPVGATIEKESDYPIEAIEANDVLHQIRGAQPRAAILVLDACRDNPLAATTRSATKGLGRMSAPTGTMIAFATAPGDTASDNGHYARVLAAELQKPGQELVDVFRNTAAEVRRLSAGGSKQQDPRISEMSINERLYLAGPGVKVASVTPVPTGQPVVSPPQADLEQEVWQAAKAANTVAAYEAYLAEYPRGKFASAARIARSALVAAGNAGGAGAATLANQSAVQASTPSPQPAQPGQSFRDCTGPHCPELVVIPAGSFVMGSNDYDSEMPLHRVNIRSFALGKYEVTQGQWKAVMGSNPSHFSGIFNRCGDRCPVESVSWDDIQQYLAKLNGMTGIKYRLASEAEWEYAARAGSTGKYWWGETASHEYANYGKDECCGPLAQGRDKWEFTAPVGQFPANGFGMHDMHGNVWEWVEDVWHDGYAGASTEGSAWKSGGDSTRRVLRGGSWNDDPDYLRSASRNRNSPGYRGSSAGFRLARTVP